jgi:hypothetical protein
MHRYRCNYVLFLSEEGKGVIGMWKLHFLNFFFFFSTSVKSRCSLSND